MLTLSDSRIAAADRLRGYFDLQLRFGYGRIVDGQVAEGWRDYLGALSGLESQDARVALTQTFFVSAPAEPLPGGDRQFGCFGYDVPDELGVVRIHFGTSWLYHVPAYCRLFPQDYVQAREVLTRGHRFDGMSSWGQFIDHAGQVKMPIREAFLQNLAELDPDRLWAVFPYPALRTEAPIEIFHDHFKEQARA